MKTRIILLIATLRLPFSIKAQSRNDAGLQGDAGAVSGFFDANVPINFPTGATSWWHFLDVRHSNTSNNFAMQFSGSFFDQDLYFRKTHNNPATNWSKVLLERGGIVTTGRLLVNDPPIDNASDGLQIKSGLSIYGSSSNLGNHIVFRRSEGAEMAYVGWENESYANSPFVIKSSNGNPIKFMINDAEMMQLKEGNLSIGTNDSKGYKLAVNGKIRAQEIKVEASPWPDYVFSKSYQLPTLQETEKYIKEKGHLQGIPSAEEVKANGVDLGEMNAKLLQKIEELTLHLIEQNKRNDENQQKLKNQEMKNTEYEWKIKMLENRLNKIQSN